MGNGGNVCADRRPWVTPSRDVVSLLLRTPAPQLEETNPSTLLCVRHFRFAMPVRWFYFA